MLQNANPVIGYIMMGGSAKLETEFHRGLPEQAEIATTRVPFRDVSYKGLLEMIDRLPDAARILAEARPSVIAVTNFIASCIRGPEIVNLIQQLTGIPTVVPALETVSVLKELGSKKIALISGFTPELQMLEKLFFSQHQIALTEVVEVQNTLPTDPFAMSRIDYTDAAEKIRQADFGAADAIFTDMPTFHFTPEVCAALPQGDRRPVLSMLNVLPWATFGRLDLPRGSLYLSQFLTP